MAAPADVPVRDVDLFTDAALDNPWPLLAELRALGPVVWMEATGTYALTRYDACRDALRNPDLFCSSQGVGFDEAKNAYLGGRILLCSDGEDHRAKRRVIGAPLTPKALESVRPRLVGAAADVVTTLAERGTFDVATELARHLPLEVISRLVGIPEAGRQRMIGWAAATFDTSGPPNDRSRAAEPAMAEFRAFMEQECVPGKLAVDGWAQGVWDAAARGEIDPAAAPSMMVDYLGPSLDTTILGIGSMLHAFATHPDQWARLRADRSLVLNAVHEVLRYQPVVRAFTRVTTAPARIDGSTSAVPAGERVAVWYLSANRDERYFPEPDRFDIARANAADHLAFGAGPHTCVGANLARLEMREVLNALLDRVSTIELVDSEPYRNNLLHGFARCVVRVG